jgi:hypothetical protein
VDHHTGPAADREGVAMPDVDVTVNIDVYCAKCGSPLCNVTNVRYGGNRSPKFDVTPCENCLEKESDAAYERGFENGREQGTHETNN